MEKKITTVREPARDIPVRASADILIVGGGPAGLMAAQAAAVEGLKVMLLTDRISSLHFRLHDLRKFL